MKMMKIDKDPKVVSDHYGHHLLNAKGEKVKTFSKDRAGLKQARMSLYKNFKSMDLPPIDPTKQEENKMSDLEKRLEEALNETVTVNTTSNSDPNSEDTVTITATGEDAQDMLDMVRLAGINQPTEEQPETDLSVADMIQIIPLDDAEDEVVEELANTPNDAMDLEGDVDTMVNKISGGLNRRKKAYAKAEDGDNPMAVEGNESKEELTARLLKEYDEFKVTAPEDSDEGNWEIENVGNWAIKIGKTNDVEASDKELGFDTELAAELADEAMTEAEDEDLDEGLRIEYKDGTCAGSKCPDDRNRDKMKAKGVAPEEFDKPKKATPPNSDALDKEMSEEVESDEDNVDEGAGCKSKKKVKEDIEKQELDIDENELEEFYDYVLKFYGPDQIYDMGATRDMVQKATKEYIQDKNTTWGGGDSLDREKVRDIMIDTFDLELKESTNEKESVNLDLIKKLAGI